MVQEFVGAVRIFAGDYAPTNFALAQGQLLSIQQNTALFSLLGTTYGGNGVSTFQLPDLRGRLPLGQGQGPGLSPRVIGEQSGTENVSLLSPNVPQHNHVFNASTTAATGHAAGPSVLLGQASTAFYAANGGPNVRPVQINPNAVSYQGGNQPHNNIQPSIALSYIIALYGIFPSRG